MSPKKSTTKSTKSTKTAAKSAKPSRKYPKVPQNALVTYQRETLEKALKIDAKALGIPSGSAKIFIKRTLDAAEKTLKPKKIITEHDLTSAIAKELKKYNADFAYIYQNRDKII